VRADATLSLVEARERIKVTLKEFVNSADVTEVERDLRALAAPFYHHEVVKQALLMAAEDMEHVRVRPHTPTQRTQRTPEHSAHLHTARIRTCRPDHAAMHGRLTHSVHNRACGPSTLTSRLRRPNPCHAPACGFRGPHPPCCLCTCVQGGSAVVCRAGAVALASACGASCMPLRLSAVSTCRTSTACVQAPMMSLLAALTKTAEVSSLQVVKGFQRLVDQLDDLALDVPGLQASFHTLCADAVAAGVLEASDAAALAAVERAGPHSNLSPALAAAHSTHAFKATARAAVREFFDSADYDEVASILQVRMHSAMRLPDADVRSGRAMHAAPPCTRPCAC
jgi:MA3 domain